MCAAQQIAEITRTRALLGHRFFELMGFYGVQYCPFPWRLGRLGVRARSSEIAYNQYENEGPDSDLPKAQMEGRVLKKKQEERKRRDHEHELRHQQLEEQVHHPQLY
ncbi:hypothetical protein F5883DRAFT_635000 [Diaporthe sp. PMI_573]|nr:hypothetical protein F5883DRAFT_635000 [Diaporthaceae sp. PMI_573]